MVGRNIKNKFTNISSSFFGEQTLNATCWNLQNCYQRLNINSWKKKLSETNIKILHLNSLEFLNIK